MVNMSTETFIRTDPNTTAPVGNAIRPISNLKSRLPIFVADWSHLHPTNPRFADGCALLNKLNPRRPGAARAVEVRSHPDDQLPALDTLESYIDLEIENLEPERCMVSSRPDGTTATVGEVHDALSRGEPLLVGVHAPLRNGLGSLAPQGATGTALVLGTGAIARTCTSARAPVATRQLCGQALIVFWPASHDNHEALRGAGSLRHVISRLDRLDNLRAVVLRAGETHVLPAGARYITLSLGDERSSFAVQFKYPLAEQINQQQNQTLQVQQDIATIGKRSRTGERDEINNVYHAVKRIKIEDM